MCDWSAAQTLRPRAPIAQATAYAAALEQLQCTKEALADRLGISRSQLSHTMRLLGVPEHLQEQVAAGVLTAAHGRSLLRVPNIDEQDALADRIREEQMTARGAEAPARAAVTRQPLDPQLAGFANLLTGLLDAKVKVTRAGDRAKMVLDVPEADLAGLLSSFGAPSSIATYVSCGRGGA